ncbi:MAG: hypothetical protein EOM67_01620 [Spirochaetia bacterium]|nr:hypothetical protein [Spirochaetia bacterium]
MHRYYFAKFKHKDAYLINIRDKDEISRLLDIAPNMFESLEKEELEAYTVFKDKNPLLIVYWKTNVYGARELCMIAGESLKDDFNHKVLYIINTILDMVKTGCYRVHSLVAENETNKRFLEYLGFDQESKMEFAGFDGDHMYMYSWVQRHIRYMGVYQMQSRRQCK